MKILAKLNELRQRLTKPDDVARHSRIFPRRVVAGVHINEDIANTYSAMWCARRVISQNIACLSWDVHEDRSGGGTNVVSDDPVQTIIHRQVNPEMTSFTFREAIIGHALFWGNGYAEIERDLQDRPLRMWLLPPDKVTPRRDEQGNIFYEVRNGAGVSLAKIPLMNMFHLKGLGFDGLVGHSMVAMARESIGMAIAAERFGAAFYGNDSRPGGVLMHPNKLKPEARDNIKKEFEEIHRGAGNSWRVALFEEGLQWQTIGVPPEDAQYIETRKFQVTEVSRWTGLPPSLLGDWENAHFNNVEQQRMLLVGDAVKPWAFRLDCEASWKLFGRNTRSKRSTRLNIDSLLTSDTKTRFQAIAVGRQWGLLTANEGREMLGLNPLPNKQNGGESIIPQNMGPASKLMEDKKPKPVKPPTLPPKNDVNSEGGDGEGDEEVIPQRSLGDFKESYRRIFEDIFTRSLGREKARINDRLSLSKAIGFYEQHIDYLARSLEPAAMSLVDLVGSGPSSVCVEHVRTCIREYAKGYSERSWAAASASIVANAVPELLEQWESKPLENATRLTDLLIMTCRSHSHDGKNANAA